MCQSTTILIYKKIVISTFKCQDIQVLLFPCFLFGVHAGETIHPSIPSARRPLCVCMVMGQVEQEDAEW
jgi:hypothetical protein